MVFYRNLFMSISPPPSPLLLSFAKLDHNPCDSLTCYSNSYFISVFKTCTVFCCICFSCGDDDKIKTSDTHLNKLGKNWAPGAELSLCWEETKMFLVHGTQPASLKYTTQNTSGVARLLSSWAMTAEYVSGAQNGGPCRICSLKQSKTKWH